MDLCKNALYLKNATLFVTHIYGKRSLLLSQNGIDDHDALSNWWRKWSTFYHHYYHSSMIDDELKEFIRLQAKAQQLDILQQLDNGMRFIDLRIMFECDDTDHLAAEGKVRAGGGATSQWYCIHAMQSTSPAIHYLQSIQEWLILHPHEIIVIWISKKGSTTDTGTEAYPNVSTTAKKEFWRSYVEIFQGGGSEMRELLL